MAKLAEISVDLVANVGKFTSGMKKAAESAKGFDIDLQKLRLSFKASALNAVIEAAKAVDREILKAADTVSKFDAQQRKAFGERAVQDLMRYKEQTEQLNKAIDETRAKVVSGVPVGAVGAAKEGAASVLGNVPTGGLPSTPGWWQKFLMNTMQQEVLSRGRGPMTEKERSRMERRTAGFLEDRRIDEENRTRGDRQRAAEEQLRRGQDLKMSTARLERENKERARAHQQRAEDMRLRNQQRAEDKLLAHQQRGEEMQLRDQQERQRQGFIERQRAARLRFEGQAPTRRRFQQSPQDFREQQRARMLGFRAFQERERAGFDRSQEAVQERLRGAQEARQERLGGGQEAAQERLRGAHEQQDFGLQRRMEAREQEMLSLMRMQLQELQKMHRWQNETQPQVIPN